MLGRRMCSRRLADLLTVLLDGFTDIYVGEELIVLTWLRLSNRSVFQVHAGGSVNTPWQTYSQLVLPTARMRWNYIRCLLEIAGHTVRVAPLERSMGYRKSMSSLYGHRSE